jgi:hypothetical protein
MPNFSQMFSPDLPPILRGAMAGAEVPYALQGANQDLQSQATDNAKKMEDLRMLIDSTNPALTAKNSLLQNTDTAMNNPENIAAGVGANLSKNLLAQMEDKNKERDMQQQFVYHMGMEAQERAKNGQPFNPADKDSMDWFNSKVEEGKQFNLNLDKQPPAQAVPAIVNQSNSLVNTPGFLQKMAEGAQTVQGAKDVEGMRASAQRDVARTNADSRTEVQQVRNEGTANVATIRANMAQNTNQLVNQIVMDIRSGNKPSDGLINLAASQAFVTEADKTALGIRAMSARTVEEGQILKKQWMDNWKKEMFPQLYGDTPKSQSPVEPTAQSDSTLTGKVVNGYKFTGKTAAEWSDQSKWEKVTK